MPHVRMRLSFYRPLLGPLSMFLSASVSMGAPPDVVTWCVGEERVLVGSRAESARPDGAAVVETVPLPGIGLYVKARASGVVILAVPGAKTAYLAIEVVDGSAGPKSPPAVADAGRRAPAPPAACRPLLVREDAPRADDADLWDDLGPGRVARTGPRAATSGGRQ
jgi:hypothetical protein